MDNIDITDGAECRKQVIGTISPEDRDFLLKNIVNSKVILKQIRTPFLDHFSKCVWLEAQKMTHCCTWHTSNKMKTIFSFLATAETLCAAMREEIQRIRLYAR